MELDKDFKEFVELLNDKNVEYMVVGGYSVAHHGFPRYTGDFDVWINPNKSNGAKMIDVLNDFGFGSMGLTAADFMRPDKIIQFGVEPVRIDIITAIDGIGSFNEAYKNIDKIEYDKMKINFESTPKTGIFYKKSYFGCPPAGEAGDFYFLRFGDA